MTPPDFCAAGRARRWPLLLAALGALLASGNAGAKAPAGSVPIALAGPKSFVAAVTALEKATGAKAAELELQGKPLMADEGRSFRVEGHLATRLLEGSHAAFLKAGLYLFRVERSFGMGGGLDLVALVKNADRAALIRRVGTADPAGQMTTDKIVDWLAELEQEEPFQLEEIGTDFVAGRFKKVPKDPVGIARRCAEAAPELVKGSPRAIDYLTEEIRTNRTLYLIW